MRHSFANRFLNNINFAPDPIPSFSGGADGDSQQGQQQPGGDIHSHVPLFGQESETNTDLNDALAIFQSQDGDDGDDEINDTELTPWTPTEVPQEQVTALQQNIQRAIAGMQIPDDAIPDDFDPSDRNQLRTLMNHTVQAAVRQAMSVVFQPVQLAMNNLNSQIDSRINSAVTNTTTRNRAKDIIRDMVPEYDMKEYRTLIQGLDQTLIGQKKSPKERATALRKILNQMGIKASPQASSGNMRRSGDGNTNGNQSVKTGTAALDSFFGAFQLPSQK